MMSHAEREVALTDMQALSDHFYHTAAGIGCHPFLEFAGLLNEYIKIARAAHVKGIDFSECNTHSGVDLPMEPFEVNYLNEKLECIFTGRCVISKPKPEPKRAAPTQEVGWIHLSTAQKSALRRISKYVTFPPEMMDRRPGAPSDSTLVSQSLERLGLVKREGGVWQTTQHGDALLSLLKRQRANLKKHEKGN